MATFDTGQPSFGLRKCVIAVNNLDGTFGTAITVPSIKVFSVDYKTVSAKLEGDDRITATAAIATEAECKLTIGGFNMAVYQIMTGISPTSSGTGTGFNEKMLMTNVSFPYFAICGQAYAAQGSGDTHIFIPKIKIMSGFMVKLEYGQFVVPEITADAVLDDNYNAIFSIIEHGTTVTPAIPPAY